MSQSAQPAVEEFVETPEQADYFGFGGEQNFIFPDGISYITFKVMNEGQRAKFQKLTSRDMVLERRSGDARVGVNPAEERHALIIAACVAWNLKRRGQPVPFTERALRDFLQFADPSIVDNLEKAIRKANPSLAAELSVEDIDREIENLQEMREEAAKREAGEGSSSSR